MCFCTYILGGYHLNKVFRALADPTRRQILKLLADSDLTAGEISDNFNISKPSISHHLDVLRDAELVTSRRNGQQIIYSLNSTVLQEIILTFMDLFKNK